MYPFRDGDAYTTFRAQVEKVTAEINELDNDYVLKASPTELEQYFIERVMIRPLVLRAEERHILNQTGTDIDVSGDFRRAVFPGERAVVRGTRIDIAIPFEGDPALWQVRASTFSVSGYPEIEVRKALVVFSISFPDDSVEPARIRAELDRQTQSLVDAVGYLKNDVDNHNRTAPDAIRQALERKKKIAQTAAGAVAALGIPVRRTVETPAFTIPTKRRESPAKSKPPAVPPGKYQAEPVLAEKEYEHILEVLRSMSLVIERSASSFAALNEEAIRNHFLIQLNGHYEGGATGETFNASGKTDILIRADNRNVFIAECKFWHGQKGFSEALDQLLGYLTWRDSKSALLVFNRMKDSTAVRQKMHEVIGSRPEHRRTVFHRPDGDSRYVLVKPSDPGREIVLTTQLYDMPATG